MMLRLALILMVILLALTACGSAEKDPQHWVESFIHELDIRGVTVDRKLLPKISIVKKDGPGKSAATCYGEIRLIEIDEDDWSNIKDFQREMVVFHELGHCYLGIPGHTADGYMAGQTLPAWANKTYEQNRSRWIDELLDLAK